MTTKQEIFYTDERGFKERMKISTISKTRGKNRQELIKNICKEFMKSLNKDEHEFFYKDKLTTFFECDNSTIRTHQRILKELLSYLIKIGKIKESVIYKPVSFFILNRELKTQDYNSFNILMQKNGYKKNKELKDKDNDDYLKYVVGFNENEIEKTYLWNNSFKPREKQGVYSYGSKTLRLRTKNYKYVIYELIK